MSVKIRLKRLGANKDAFYRVVVADSRSPRDGRFIEELGYYDPVEEPKVVKVDAEKALKWIENGAKPTATVDRLFREYNIYEPKAEDSDEVEEAEKVEETDASDSETTQDEETEEQEA